MTSRLAFCVLLLSTIRVAAQENAAAAGQVRKLEEKWAEAYKEREIDLLSTLLTEDFVITVEDGNVFSKAGYITHSADPATKVEVAELSDLRIKVRGGNIAVVTGAYHETGRTNGKPYEYHDRLTDVWVRVGNGWRGLSSHYSVPLK